MSKCRGCVHDGCCDGLPYCGGSCYQSAYEDCERCGKTCYWEDLNPEGLCEDCAEDYHKCPECGEIVENADFDFAVEKCKACAEAEEESEARNA